MIKMNLDKKVLPKEKRYVFTPTLNKNLYNDTIIGNIYLMESMLNSQLSDFEPFCSVKFY